MNLEKMLAEAKAKLAGLKSRIEADDADAMKEAEALMEEIADLEAKLAAANRKKSILSALGNAEPKEPQAQRAKTLGDHVANAVKSAGWVRGAKHDVVAPEYKAASDVQTTPDALVAPFLTDVDRNIVEAYRRPLIVADLFGSETISGTALTYFVENPTVEGGFGMVGENGQKPQMHFGDPTPVTESLKKIAAFYKESDEILEDLSWLVSSINNRALYLHDLYEETQLLNGDGTGNNLKGLLNRDGVQTGTYEDADSIFKAAMNVQNAMGFAADAVVINPTDYQALRLAKDGNQQYYGGGYFYGAYGNTGMVEQPPIWGMRTLVTPAVAAGTVVVGAFKQGASVIRKGGVTVEMTNTNEDDFTNNRVTVRIENRLALAVRYPGAFVKLTASN